MSIPTLQKGLDRVEVLIIESQNQMKRVEELMRSTRTESNTRFGTMMEEQNSKFASLKTELSAMRTDLNGIKTGMTQKMDALERKMSTLEVNFKKLDDGLRQG
jgi:SMC interacting uncharacterized protein involved in chromosome segregation